MKRSEIVVGGRYSNGKGGVREVLGFPAQALSRGVHYWQDAVRYKVLAGRYKGKIKIISIRSFASWAKGKDKPCRFRM